MELTGSGFAGVTPGRRCLAVGRLLLWTLVFVGTADRGAAQAVELDAAYTGDAFYNLSGGLREDAAFLHNVDLTADLDGLEAFGLPGFEAHLYILANEGGSLTEIAGDWQVASNIEAPAAVRLFELWVQQRWAETWSLRVGLSDVNSEFYVSEAATLFLNSGHGIGPEFGASGITGPSIFPVTALAARLRWEPGPVYAQVAVLDGVPGHPEDERRFVHIDLGSHDGALAIGEVGFADDDTGRKVALGAWSYTREFPDAVDSGRTRDGTFGAYLLAETALLGDEASGRSLAGFSRIGYADPAVHPVSWSWGGGLVHTGLLRPDHGDQLGLGVTSGVHASRYVDAREMAGAPVDRTETAFELTYSVQLTPWLRVQPDIQYILNPGMDPALDHALLFGTRVELGLPPG